MKTSLIIKIILGAIPVLIFLIWFIFHQIEGHRYEKLFFESTFEAKVVSFNSYYGRTIEVSLDNGFTLYFFPPIDSKIMVGDVIKKKNNTYEYFIYRKTSKGDYQFWSSNNFNDIE